MSCDLYPEPRRCRTARLDATDDAPPKPVAAFTLANLPAHPPPLDTLAVELPLAAAADFLDILIAGAPESSWVEPAPDRPRGKPGIRLGAHRRTFGWTWTLGPALGDAEVDLRPPRATFVIAHEVVSPRGSVTLQEIRDGFVLDPRPADPRFRWLQASTTDGGMLGELGGARDRAVLPVLRLFARFRLDALDEADRRLEGIDPVAGALVDIAPTLHDCVLTALRLDHHGRLAELVRRRPGVVQAVGIALGDRPEAWARDDRLAAPLALAADGRKDRDVLAAAIELGCGGPVTRDRIARLNVLGHRMGDQGDEVLAHYAFAIDAPGPLSWIPRDSSDVASWCAGQAWAAALHLPADAKRYVARYGAEVREQVHGCLQAPLCSRSLASALAHGARDALATRTTPKVLMARELARTFPIPDGLRDEVERDGWRAQRLSDGATLDAVGRSMRLCLRSGSAHVWRCHAGTEAYYLVEHETYRCVVRLVDMDTAWFVTDMRANRNDKVPRTLRPTIAALMRDAGAGGEATGEDLGVGMDLG